VTPSSAQIYTAQFSRIEALGKDGTLANDPRHPRGHKDGAHRA
jgi:hypothetical protein